jgi:hypothetical protein
MNANLIKTWRKNGFTLRLYDNGQYSPVDRRVRLGYQFKDGRKVIFEGDDYGPSPTHSIDGLDSVYGLLGFLAVMPGDTDAEYFDKYTGDQINWVQSSRCEELSMLVYDYENPI